MNGFGREADLTIIQAFLIRKKGENTL